ncbi:MAG: ferredoxin--NADP reductase [Polyangiaceae bacterium]
MTTAAVAAAEDAFRADSKAYHDLRVARVIPETSDSCSVVVDIPARLARQFAYQAGQFLTFKVEHSGRVLTRCYSLSSSPDTDSELRVTIKRVADGRVSNWFNDSVQVGDTLRVLPPAGRFTLRDRETPLLLFAGGSGVTPVLSILKTALATTARRVRLIYANRDVDSIIFKAELEALQATHAARFELLHHLDAERGFLQASDVQTQVAGWLDADCYVCGPSAFMDLVEHTLLSASVPREHVFVERFVSPSDPDEVSAKQANAKASGELAVPAQIRVRWDKKLHLVPYQAGQTLLQAAVAAGVDPPYSCEEGYCSSCQAKLTAGEVKMAVNDCLSDDEIADGCILACQAYPLTEDIEIDWDA